MSSARTTPGRVVAATEVRNAVSAVDSPWQHPGLPGRLAAMLRDGWDGEPPRGFLGTEDGRAVAYGSLSTSEWDNTRLAWLGVLVHPQARRRGLGSALLAHLTGEARVAGRSSIGIDGWDDAAARGFAEHHDLECRSRAVNRRQVLAEVDPAYLVRRYDEARTAASAYELVEIVGRTPSELLEAVAEMTRAINDAPTDDLDIEDEVFTAKRVSAYEDAQLARGDKLYRLVARHRGTGELAGHTVVAVERDRPWIGDQHDTSVVAAHRGHRLGLLLKAGMLRWLARCEPDLRTIDTWNAESNDHMVAVNERLGYRVLGRELQFQRSLTG